MYPSASETRAFASVKFDDSVACWGDAQSAPSGSSFISVSAGTFHIRGITVDGSVACWWNTTETLMDYVYVGQETPPGGTFTSVSAGYVHTCGVKADGSVMCWGMIPSISLRHLLELSNPSPREEPFTCGMKADRSVVCWGSDSAGQSAPR